MLKTGRPYYLVAIAAILSLGMLGKPSAASRRAPVPPDRLLTWQRHAAARTRAIVRDTVAGIDAVARRHGLTIVGRLAGTDSEP